MENKPKQEDILNAILPPREWVENGKLQIFLSVFEPIFSQSKAIREMGWKIHCLEAQIKLCNWLWANLNFMMAWNAVFLFV